MGQRVVLPVGEALHELAALLHDGEVGARSWCQRCSQSPWRREGGDQVLGGGNCSRIQAELLRPGGPHGRGNLDNGDHARDQSSASKHVLGVVPLAGGPPVGQWVTHWPQKAQSASRDLAVAGSRPR